MFSKVIAWVMAVLVVIAWVGYAVSPDAILPATAALMGFVVPAYVVVRLIQIGSDQ